MDFFRPYGLGMVERSVQRGIKKFWICFVYHKMLFFLANCGMHFGELVKVKCMNGKICCLVQVHSSAQIGAREANAMGSGFSKRVWGTPSTSER